MTEEVDTHANALRICEKHDGRVECRNFEHGLVRLIDKNNKLSTTPSRNAPSRYLKEQERAEQVRRQAAEQIIEEEGVGEFR